MRHLTVDEIIGFVTLSSLDAASLRLASDVTAHIRGCAECMRKVQAYQLVYDKLESAFPGDRRQMRTHAPSALRRKRLSDGDTGESGAGV